MIFALAGKRSRALLAQSCQQFCAIIKDGVQCGAFNEDQNDWHAFQLIEQKFDIVINQELRPSRKLIKEALLHTFTKKKPTPFLSRVEFRTVMALHTGRRPLTLILN